MSLDTEDHDRLIRVEERLEALTDRFEQQAKQFKGREGFLAGMAFVVTVIVNAIVQAAVWLAK